MRSADGALEKMVRRKRWVGMVGEGRQGILVWSEWGANFFMKEVQGNIFSKVLLDVLKLLVFV